MTEHRTYHVERLMAGVQADPSRVAIVNTGAGDNLVRVGQVGAQLFDGGLRRLLSDERHFGRWRVEWGNIFK